MAALRSSELFWRRVRISVDIRSAFDFDNDDHSLHSSLRFPSPISFVCAIRLSNFRPPTLRFCDCAWCAAFSGSSQSLASGVSTLTGSHVTRLLPNRTVVWLACHMTTTMCGIREHDALLSHFF